jgi:phospholipid/cholesterol/gamma-HCH transport system substrate-binding protein
MRRLLVATAVAAAAALALSACDANNGLEVRAVFDDISDLVPRGHVKIADVPVGIVSGIELTDDHQALVTMRLEPDVDLPSVVHARLRKTNVLGERFVELVPDRDSGGSLDPDTVITETAFVGELEELVLAGSEVLAAVTADRIAGALEAGAVGMEGRGQTFGALLDDLTEIISTYDRNSDDLIRLIDGMEAFLADAGPEAELHGRALEEVAEAMAVLEREDDRLLDTLAEVRSLSRISTDIMVTHRQRIDDFWFRFNAVTRELARVEADIARFPYAWHLHNHNTIRGINAEHAQLVADIVVCGVNDLPGDPIRSCYDPPQGRERPPAEQPSSGPASRGGGR